MIVKLQAGDYEKARPIFAGFRNTVAIDATLEGNCPGAIYVDNVTQPSAAFIWNDIRYGFLAGDAGNNEFVSSLARLLDGVLLLEAQCSDDPSLLLYPNARSWCARMHEIIQSRDPVRLTRQTFVFQPDQFSLANWRERLPSGFRVARIDHALLSRQEHLTNEINALWTSVERFLAGGFGVCLLQDDRVLSHCFSAFVSDVRYEISIATQTGYRRKGLATITAAAFIDHCLQNGLIPVWQCWGGNTASVNLAQKLGFRPDIEYPVFFYDLNPDTQQDEQEDNQ